MSGLVANVRRRPIGVAIGILGLLIASAFTVPGRSSASAPTGMTSAAGKDVEALATEPGWAGAWLDARGRTHVNVKLSTRAAVATIRTGLLRAEVTRSLTDLDAIHTRAERVLDAGGLSGQTKVRVDVARNAVAVAVTPKALVRAQALLQSIVGVLVESDPRADAKAAPTVCVDRINCGVPIRGGVEIHAGIYTCSAGFSATGSDGSHWLLTAGHCGPLDKVFSHGSGNEYYGPVRQKYDSNVQNAGWFDPTLGRPVWLDFLRIRVDNPYWRSLPGGYLYATPTSTVDVKSALAPEALTQGQTICRSSFSYNHSETADHCGQIVTYNGQQGRIEISGMVTCSGDSGGAMYVQVAGGGRRAVGIHSGIYYTGSKPNCVQPGQHVWITGVTWAYHYMDINSNATIRVDTR